MAQDLSFSFLLDQSPEKVFTAVNNVRGWWSAKTEGNTQQEGDEFIYRHKDMHYSKHKLTAVIPNKKVVWLVTDSSLSFLKQKKDEWTGTEVIFDIAKEGDKTRLTFTHIGLYPEVECYEACKGGWSYYLHESLLPLIETGTGNPDN